MKTFKYADTTSPTEMTVAMYEMLSQEDAVEVLNKIQIIANKKLLGADNFGELAYNEETGAQAFRLCCPTCQSESLCKNGYANEKQRYLCKICGATFFASSKTLSAGTKQNVGVWMQFVLGLLNGDTCEELSRKCLISVPTAFYWRLKVFAALEYLSQETVLKGVIFADDTRFPYNFKGNHNDEFIYPRRAHKRGHQNTMKNHQRNTICVLCALDSAGHSFSRCIGFGNASGKRLSAGFRDKLAVDETTVLVTDGAQSYKRVVNDYSIPRWEKKTTVKKKSKRFPNMQGDLHIQAINGYHSRLKAFFAPFKNVASRYLPGYLLLFDFRENHKHLSNEAMAKTIVEAMMHIPGATTLNALSERFLIPVSNGPEVELWERKIPRKEQQIYREWCEKVPVAEICAKHKIERRKIYAIKEKVDKYGVQDKILHPEPKQRKNALRPLSERDWTLFLRCYRDGESYVAVGRDYGLTKQRIEQIVKRITNRPEGLTVKKYASSEAKKKPKVLTRERLYKDLQLVHLSGSTYRCSYEIIGKMHGRTMRSVGEKLRKIRSERPDFPTCYHWSNERKVLPAEDYYAFLKKRNQSIYDEVVFYQKENPGTKQEQAFQAVAEKYRLSTSRVCVIYYEVKRGFFPQYKPEKHQFAPRKTEVYCAVRDVLLANPHLSNSAAIRLVADKMGLSPGTVSNQYYHYRQLMQQGRAPVPGQEELVAG